MSIHLNFNGYWRDVNYAGVPNKPGIYCIYVGTYNEDGTVTPLQLLYIGESNDAGERISSYRSGSARQALMNYVGFGNTLMYTFAETNAVWEESATTASNRLNWERQLIWENTPPTNSKVPTSNPGYVLTHSGCNALLK